jgi:hypothetical protein
MDGGGRSRAGRGELPEEGDDRWGPVSAGKDVLTGGSQVSVGEKKRPTYLFGSGRTGPWPLLWPGRFVPRGPFFFFSSFLIFLFSISFLTSSNLV